MPVAHPQSAPSVFGLVLTLDPASPGLGHTLATLRAFPRVVLAEPRMPYAALSLATTDARADHAWLESLPGVVAVDVAFAEVAPEPADFGGQRRRARRLRDPDDDSLLIHAPAPRDIPSVMPL